jgi:hypothetical protein
MAACSRKRTLGCCGIDKPLQLAAKRRIVCEAVGDEGCAFMERRSHRGLKSFLHGIPASGLAHGGLLRVDGMSRSTQVCRVSVQMPLILEEKS